jgi:hypothetical protein
VIGGRRPGPHSGTDGGPVANRFHVRGDPPAWGRFSTCPLTVSARRTRLGVRACLGPQPARRSGTNGGPVANRSHVRGDSPAWDRFSTCPLTVSARRTRLGVRACLGPRDARRGETDGGPVANRSHWRGRTAGSAPAPGAVFRAPAENPDATGAPGHSIFNKTVAARGVLECGGRAQRRHRFRRPDRRGTSAHRPPAGAKAAARSASAAVQDGPGPTADPEPKRPRFQLNRPIRGAARTVARALRRAASSSSHP